MAERVQSTSGNFQRFKAGFAIFQQDGRPDVGGSGGNPRGVRLLATYAGADEMAGFNCR